VRAADLAGYRSGPVYIRRSKHVPPPRDAVRDCMPVLFELLANETEPAARAVLGHFVFVYIHPYLDGNGRMGRFLMNVMLASGGYPWTVIPLERRNDCRAALGDQKEHTCRAVNGERVVVPGAPVPENATKIREDDLSWSDRRCTSVAGTSRSEARSSDRFVTPFERGRSPRSTLRSTESRPQARVSLDRAASSRRATRR
jgi:hypothetical protein